MTLAAVILTLASTPADAQDVAALRLRWQPPQTAEGDQRPGGSLRLTLDEAIAEATANSHRLGELRARAAAASAVVDQRSAAQKPVVTTQLGYQRTNHVDEFTFFAPVEGFRVLYPDVPDNYRSRIELQWPIYTGGRLQALERAAQAEVEFSGQNLATARADLRLEVTRAFWSIVTARESARVLEEAVKRVDGQLADVRAKFDAGLVPPNDVLLVEAQRARQQVSLIEARNLAAVTEADLARLVGAADGTAIAVDAVLEQPAPATTKDAAALLTEGRAGRSERAALQISTRIAEERQAAARAGRLPTVALISGFDYARPNPRIFPRDRRMAAHVGCRREPELDGLGLGAHARGSVRGGEPGGGHPRAAGRLRHDLGARDPPAHARPRLGDGADRGGAAKVSARATEARRVVQERFAAGVATTTDLLDAQVALLQAELDRTRALANARLASARLERALGR